MWVSLRVRISVLRLSFASGWSTQMQLNSFQGRKERALHLFSTFFKETNWGRWEAERNICLFYLEDVKFIQQIMRYKKGTWTQVEELLLLYTRFEKVRIYSGGRTRFTLWWSQPNLHNIPTFFSSLFKKKLSTVCFLAVSQPQGEVEQQKPNTVLSVHRTSPLLN